MKQLYFILFLSFFINIQASFAQQIKSRIDFPENQYRFDSLKQLIAGSPDDTSKVMRLIALSNLFSDTKNATTTFALEALSIAKKIHFIEGIAMAYSEIGTVNQERKDYKSAINNFQQALNLCDKNSNYLSSAGFYSGLLNLFFYMGDYPNAMEIITREMTVAEKNNDKRRIAHCNNILGYIYFKQENFNEAEKYYALYIRNAKELKDSMLLAHALGEVADVYIQEKKLKQSTDVLLRTIQICDENLADTGIRDANQTNGWALQYKAKAMYRLGKTYKLLGDMPKALQYSLTSVKYATNISTSKYDIASYYINAGDVYKRQKDFKKAIEFLGYGFNLAREIQHRENIMEAAEYLSQTYALEHKYDSAFFYYQLFTGLKDSIVNNETKMKIAEIQDKYDVVKKDKEIAWQREFRNILIGSFAFILILILFLYNSYRFKQKSKNQDEYNRQQNDLFNAIVSAQDQERKRIAQDIHDSLGSLLSASRLKLSSIEESKQVFTPDQLEKYQTTLALLNEASTELRNISHNIMPATLSKLGLVAALQNLINKISTDSGIQIYFTEYGFDGRIKEAMEISIYRVILELINNIVKHAGADKVTIQLIKYSTYLNLTIEDNGRGFDYDKVVDEKKGIGLGNILSRVEFLKGSIDIDSTPGKGTTVIIEIPSIS
jgi:two-component system NarL family sensor kinase